MDPDRPGPLLRFSFFFFFFNSDSSSKGSSYFKFNFSLVLYFFFSFKQIQLTTNFFCDLYGLTKLGSFSIIFNSWLIKWIAFCVSSSIKLDLSVNAMDVSSTVCHWAFLSYSLWNELGKCKAKSAQNAVFSKMDETSAKIKLKTFKNIRAYLANKFTVCDFFIERDTAIFRAGVRLNFGYFLQWCQ